VKWIIEVCVIIRTIAPYNIFSMVEVKLTFSVYLAKIKKSAYFTIWLFFATIHGSHCTFGISTNFYLYL